MKYRQEKEKPESLPDYNEQMGGVDLTTNSFNHIFWKERNKMTKWYIIKFRWLLSVTILTVW
jgi:hypothetical protein